MGLNVGVPGEGGAEKVRGVTVTVGRAAATYRAASADGSGDLSPEAVRRQLNRVSRLAAWTLWAGNRAFPLEYALDDDAQERWRRLTQALSALAKAQRLWEIMPRGYDGDAGQASPPALIVKRTLASLRPALPPAVTSNLQPYCLQTLRRRFFFFPDRLYVLFRGAFEALEYPSLRLDADTTQFTEEQEVPGDAQIVGKRWRYADPSGGPDRSVRDNYRVSVTQYGVLTLTSESGPLALLHVSSAGASDQFAALFRSFLNPNAPERNAPANPAPPRFSLADCHRRLGLPAFCTKSDATARYRQLVLTNHPDRMSRAAPEVREAANAQLQEIVQAYKELKRLRGW